MQPLNPPEPATRRSWVDQLPPIWFWGLVFLLLLALRAPSLFVEVLDTDEAGHAVGSQVWLQGGALYHDYVDNKQPLLYWTFAGIFRLFGQNLIAVHALTIPWLWLTAFLLHAIARDVWSNGTAGRIAAIIFVLTSSASVEKDMLATNTEVLMNLPLVAAFWLVGVRAGLGRFGAGVALGLATLFSLKALVALPVLLATAVTLERQWWRRWRFLEATGFGVLVPLLAVMSLFAAQGRLDELVYWNVLLNQKYAAAGVPLWSFEIRRGILYGFPRLLIFVAMTGVAWVGAVLASRDVFRQKGALTHPALIHVAWLGLSFYPVCAGGRFYGHYFIQLLPPLAILASGWLASRRVTTERPTLERWLWLALVLPILGYTVLGYVRLALHKLEGQHASVERVASYIRTHTKPTDRLFIWGYWSQVYYYAHRPPASRFVYPQTLAGYIPGSPRSLDPNDDTSEYRVAVHWDQLRDDLQRHPAELILDTAPAAIHYWEKYPIAKYPWLSQLLRDQYRLETTIDRVAIYRRKP